MLGFTFAYRLAGGAPTVQPLAFAAEETLTVGDIAVESSGAAKLGATAGSKFLGAVLGTKKPTSAFAEEFIEVITDSDAVYSVTDNNARKMGDTLDLTGATGKQKLAASSNKEFVVVATKVSSTEPTLVRFNTGKHLYNTAQ